MDDNDNLVIARILEGGTIDKQGLLTIGDVILEVNGVPVSTPEELQTEISKSKDSVTLKIGATPTTETHSALVTNGTNTVANGNAGKKLTVSHTMFFSRLFTILIS